MTLRPLPEALAGDDRLRALQQQGLWLWRVQQALTEFLPPAITKQLTVGAFQEGTLTLMSPSGLVIGKLKAMGPTIAAELSARGFPVAAIRWRVRPELAHWLASERPPVVPHAAPRPLSPAARAALEELLAQLPADEPLAEALRSWLTKDSERQQPLQRKEEQVEEQQRPAP